MWKWSDVDERINHVPEREQSDADRIREATRKLAATQSF